MKNIPCIILARGGSKRVPRKNIRTFCGKPILAWGIEAALSSHIFSSVVVSTENEEIAAIAKQYGAQVPFMRPKNLADDYSSTAEVLLDFFSEWQKKSSLPKYCCCLYGTSAMVTHEHLRAGFEKIQQQNVECVYAVTEYTHPIERAVYLDDENILRYRQDQYTAIRTQDIKPSYYDIGLFYWLSVADFLKKGGKSFSPLQKTAVIIPKYAAIDIDSNEDWIFAEKIAQLHGLK